MIYICNDCGHCFTLENSELKKARSWTNLDFKSHELAKFICDDCKPMREKKRLDNANNYAKRKARGCYANSN
jgi:hypothetical protein